MTDFNKAVELKKRLDDLRPLKKEDELRIMQKFRLDWNFHSNNLEGNSLSYGETKALILFGITAQGKPLKDHFELTGHDKAIKWVEDVIKDNRPLTESFIRQLHQLLLKESYETDAITPEGKPTKKTIKVGEYKTTPNHVLTKTGEIFRFATPEETPAMMTDLIDWYSQKSQIENVNPILLAAEFHYRFIRIHPFDDGNGRCARILMNFILMKFGYPPVIIKTQDKENYFAALRQADAGILEAFVDYITENLIYSLEIMLKGAKGESIDEPEDIDKQIAILERKLEGKGKKIEKVLSEEVLKKFMINELPKIIFSFLDIEAKLQKFYLKSEIDLIYGNVKLPLSKLNLDPKFDTNTFLDRFEDIIINSDTTIERFLKDFYQGHLILTSTMQRFNRRELGEFSYTNKVIIFFHEMSYDLIYHGKLTKLYHEELTQEEIDDIMNAIAQKHLQFIEEKIKEQ